MNEVSTVGLDIAKKVFQVHALDRTGAVVVRRSLRRAQVVAWFARLPRCLVVLHDRTCNIPIHEFRRWMR